MPMYHSTRIQLGVLTLQLQAVEVNFVRPSFHLMHFSANNESKKSFIIFNNNNN